MILAKSFPALVWVAGLKGPEPQIWYGQQYKDQKPVMVLQATAIDDTSGDWARSLGELAERYPFKLEVVEEKPLSNVISLDSGKEIA